MILGSDHGATISVDRGKTWTSWYNQPTGQIYHVVTDDAFPYVVYGMQQDNGTAGVYSRTDHESINARDWFIAAQSESGYVALDPIHKEFLYASGPNGSVVRFNKKTSLAQDITPMARRRRDGRRDRQTQVPRHLDTCPGDVACG